MPTRNVVLTDHQAELLDRLVASGRYQNASEVIRAGVRMLEAEEEQRQAVVNRINAAISDFETHGPVAGSAEDIIRDAFDTAIVRAAPAQDPDAA